MKKNEEKALEEKEIVEEEKEIAEEEKEIAEEQKEEVVTENIIVEEVQNHCKCESFKCGKSVKERMIDISAEIKIAKSGKNTYYDYITPEDMTNALVPLLKKHQLFCHFNVEKLETGRNLAVLKVEDFNTDYGAQSYSMNVPDIILQRVNEIQSAGGLMTYCRRYLLMGAFSIADNSEDFDNDKSPNSPTNKSNAKNKVTENKPDPNEKLKKTLTALCQDKLKLFGKEAGMVEIMKILTKYEEKGTVAKMSTESLNLAIEEMSKLVKEGK